MGFFGFLDLEKWGVFFLGFGLGRIVEVSEERVGSKFGVKWD